MRRSASEPISQIAERDHVGCEGNRLGVEIAARKRFIVIPENERVVGGGVECPLRWPWQMLCA
jgi:hypothetical protein